MLPSATRQFRRLFDIYYWKTAVLIAENNLGRQYRNSFLGMLWTLVQPVTMVLIYSLIMPLIMRFPQEDYILFIIASLPLWTFISGCLVASGQSILSQAETLKRCMISSTVFPVADVLKNAYTYAISFIAMYIVAALMLWRFDPIVLLLPLYLLPLLAIIMAASIALAFVAPYIRDMGELVTMGLNALFWLTPILYPLSVLPEYAQRIMLFNPLYIMIAPVQDLAFRHQLPSADMTLRLLVLTVLAVVVSYFIYRKCRRNYVYYL